MRKTFFAMLALRMVSSWTVSRHASLSNRSAILHRRNANVLFSSKSFQGMLPTRTAPTKPLFARGFTTDDDDWKVPHTVSIPEDLLEISFVRSSGAGGQNVNKVNTQVQIKLKLDFKTCGSWIPDEVRSRLKEQQSNRINKENELVLRSQEHRTQVQNRKAAIDKLREMVLEAWPRPKIRKKKTISKETKQRILEEKRRHGAKKSSRRGVDF